MSDKNIPFQVIIRTRKLKQTIPANQAIQPGKTLQFPGLRVRMVGCTKVVLLGPDLVGRGHIVHCLEGELISEMENGEQSTLTKGMTYATN